MNIEDLTPLMYIQYKLNGAEEFSKYRHVVIDEAQDYNVFTFYVLKKIISNSTFSIYGDLAQSLYSYKSIKNWESVVNSVFNGKCDVMYLKKSYRTTIEIMNEANKINELLGYSAATPVIRHGKDVQYCTLKNKCLKEFVLKIIKEANDKKYKSISIICKSQHIVDSTFQLLSDEIELNKISINNISQDCPICCINSYLAKGLEFDVVIVINNDKNKFDKNSSEEMKLLYVSMTRALHELYIIE